jgi:hypothetical protein
LRVEVRVNTEVHDSPDHEVETEEHESEQEIREHVLDIH